MGNTPCSNKLELSFETSAGHGWSDIVVRLNVTEDVGAQADVLHLGSYSLILKGQI